VLVVRNKGIQEKNTKSAFSESFGDKSEGSNSVVNYIFSSLSSFDLRKRWKNINMAAKRHRWQISGKYACKTS